MKLNTIMDIDEIFKYGWKFITSSKVMYNNYKKQYHLSLDFVAM